MEGQNITREFGKGYIVERYKYSGDGSIPHGKYLDNVQYHYNDNERSKFKFVTRSGTGITNIVSSDKDLEWEAYYYY